MGWGGVYNSSTSPLQRGG